MTGLTEDGCEVRGVNPRSTTPTYGHGKSDRLVVPQKPVNKGGNKSPSAERVEGRGLAKGNQFQRARYRAQRPGGSGYGER